MHLRGHANRATWAGLLLLASLGVSLCATACRRSDRTDQESADPEPALWAGDVSIDALDAPRDKGGLIAGEAVRIGLRIRGGTPPYSGTITAARIGTPAEHEPPIHADFAPTMPASDAVEIALKARLVPDARSGVYELVATVTDARGRRALARSTDFQLIGDDAPVRPTAEAPPFIEVLDVAGRRRQSFVRGETVTVHARVPGARAAAVALIGPGGDLLAETRQPFTPDGELSMPVTVPRLALAGAHTVALIADSGARLTEPMDVAGPEFAPADRLLVDGLALYGGEDRRAPRAGLIKRGEELWVEARVGGGRALVTARIRLSDVAGKVVAESEFGRAEITRPAPQARVYIQGTWRVPPDIAVGRYQLEVEVIEQDDVSARYREILVY